MEEVVEKNAIQFVRSSFLVAFFGSLTQVSGIIAFPSYNVALGFFGAYSSFARNGKATFAFIAFCTLTIILDIIFCFVNGNDSNGFRFSLSMLIFCLFAKVYALYTSSHFFASIGGASSLEDNMASSQYDALAGSMETPKSGGVYYPPHPAGQHSNSSHHGINNIGNLNNKVDNPNIQQMRKPINTFTGMTDSGSF